jgi:hypothetical protein
MSKLNKTSNPKWEQETIEIEFVFQLFLTFRLDSIQYYPRSSPTQRSFSIFQSSFGSHFSSLERFSTGEAKTIFTFFFFGILKI